MTHHRQRLTKYLLILSLIFTLISCNNSSDDSESGTLSRQIADRSWLLTDLNNTDGMVLYQFNQNDFIRQVVRFRSDDFYELITYCAQTGGFYSIENSLLTVSSTMETFIPDCAPLPELTSVNDTSGLRIFELLIELFSENEFIVDFTESILQLNTVDNNMLMFRECITDCFIQR